MSNGGVCARYETDADGVAKRMRWEAIDRSGTVIYRSDWFDISEFRLKGPNEQAAYSECLSFLTSRSIPDA